MPLKALSAGFNGGLLMMFPLICRVSLTESDWSPSQAKNPILAPSLSSTFMFDRLIVRLVLVAETLSKPSKTVTWFKGNMLS